MALAASGAGHPAVAQGKAIDPHVDSPSPAGRRLTIDLQDARAALATSQASAALAEQLSRELDAGFASTVFDWAEGKPLEDVLGESGMTPGDFVRTTKQILDLLRQIREVAPSPASATAAAAADAINRSVVAYTGV